MQNCTTCWGRKKMFKLGNAFFLDDLGGGTATCPTCNGTGQIPLDVQVEIKDVQDEETKKTEGKSTKKRETNSLQPGIS